MAADAPFVVCNPRDHTELQRWGNFCASRGFANRLGSLDRFYTKYLADPTARMDWVYMVTRKGDDQIVGSVRLFDRLIDIDEKPARMIGIGEVCSDPDRRGQGIAAAALSQAMKTTDAEEGACISLLHAAIAVMPLYAKFGFTSLVIDHVVYHVGMPHSSDASSSARSSQQLAGSNGGIRVRAADFNADLPELKRVHAATVRATGITGWTARDDAYWTQWMPRTSKGQLMVAEVCDTAGHGPNASGSGARLIAYACAHWRQGKLRLMDFGVDSTASRDVVDELLAAAFTDVWCNEWTPPAPIATPQDATANATTAASLGRPDATLLIPLPIFKWFSKDPAVISAAIAPEERDPGWMARPLPGSGGAAGGDAAVAALQLASDEGRFLVFGLDSF